MRSLESGQDTIHGVSMLVLGELRLVRGCEILIHVREAAAVHCIKYPPLIDSVQFFPRTCRAIRVE